MHDIDGIAKRISDEANGLLEKYQDQIQQNAQSNQATPFVIPQSEIDQLVESIKESNEQIRQDAINEFIERRGEVLSDQSASLKVDFDEVITYFIIKNLTDGVNRIHGAAIARQILDAERQAEIVAAVDRSKSVLSNTTVAEIGASFALFHESIAVENGWRFYRYVTSEDEVVRSSHNSRNDKVFVYGQARTVDDVPGLANNCRCFAFELTDEEAAELEFFYPEDRSLLSTAEAKKNNSVSFLPMDKFNIKAESGRVTVDVIGYIDEWDNNDYLSFKNKVQASLTSSDQVLEIRVTSQGGSAFDGLAMYSFLKSLPNRVEAHVYGYAASAATMILAAADHVVASETDTILPHKPHDCACGTDDDFKAAAEDLTTASNQYATAYSEKTGKSVEEMIAIMAQDKLMTASQAQEIGLVDEIRTNSTTASSQARKSLGVKAMSDKGTETNTDEQLADLQAENEQLKKDLAVEQSKVAAAQASAENTVDEDEIRKKIRAELIAEQKEKDELSEEIQACGLKVEGESTQEILANAVEQAGGITEGLDLTGLKAVFNSIKSTRAKRGVDDEYKGVTGAKAESNVTSIHDEINKRWGTA